MSAYIIGILDHQRVCVCVCAAGVWLGLLSSVTFMSICHLFFFFKHRDWSIYCDEAVKRSQDERDAQEAKLRMLDTDATEIEFSESLPLLGVAPRRYATLEQEYVLL